MIINEIVFIFATAKSFRFMISFPIIKLAYKTNVGYKTNVTTRLAYRIYVFILK